jgi:hypothetical protein
VQLKSLVLSNFALLLIIPKFIFKKMIEIIDLTTQTFVCKQMTKILNDNSYAK